MPAAVEARLRRTSPLGEKFVELRPMTEDPDAPLLEDGATIERTEVVADFEDVVASGTDVFAALGCLRDRLAPAGGGARDSAARAPTSGRSSTNLSTVVGGYADNTDSCRR